MNDKPLTLADIVENQVVELERLRDIIDRAPHDKDCSRGYWPGDCDCWKREARRGQW